MMNTQSHGFGEPIVSTRKPCAHCVDLVELAQQGLEVVEEIDFDEPPLDTGEVMRVVNLFPPLTPDQQLQLAEILGKIAGERPAPPVVASSGRCVLYRHFDPDDTLLYVGISATPDTRMRQHARSSDWSAFAVRAEMEWLPNRYLAEAAETRAIEQEQPIFNFNYASSGRDDRVAAYLARAGSEEVSA